MTIRCAAPTLAALLTACLAFSGCGDGDGAVERTDGLAVVTTTGMIADAARAIGGDHVRVEALMGPGVDPHLYKAGEGDVRRLTSADVVLVHGLHLESRMGEVLKRMDGRALTAAVAERVPADERLSPPDARGTHDPHVWFDVALWSHAVTAVADALCEADTAHAADYRTSAAAYLDTLRALDDHVRALAATVPPERRVLITAHDAFGYFGRAYGFEVRGLQGISTAAEAGARDVQELADFIASHRIPAIFVESSVSPRSLNAVREAVRARGFEVNLGEELFSDALGSAGTPEGTYVGMVRHNIAAIARGLGGDGAGGTP